MVRRRHTARATLVAIIAVLALTGLAAEASAHRLSAASAKSATLALAAETFADLKVSGEGATDYATGECRRRGRHAVECMYTITFADGYVCANTVRVRYQHHDSKRTEVRALPDAICVSPAGVAGRGSDRRAARRSAEASGG